MCVCIREWLCVRAHVYTQVCVRACVHAVVFAPMYTRRCACVCAGKGARVQAIMVRTHVCWHEKGGGSTRMLSPTGGACSGSVSIAYRFRLLRQHHWHLCRICMGLNVKGVFAEPTTGIDAGNAVPIAVEGFDNMPCAQCEPDYGCHIKPDELVLRVVREAVAAHLSLIRGQQRLQQQTSCV